ncbi:MAG TPA: hypothetical protein VGP25_02350 [Gemmatimonadaceae bacterium]|nr:hypothetical protein [Gemmatimonadaceae bacterium]
MASIATPSDAPRFVVRDAGVHDVARIAPLFDAYRQFYGAAPNLAEAVGFLTARQTRGESVLLLAQTREIDAGDRDGTVDRGDAIIGFAQLYPSFSSVSLGAVSILNDLYVAPAWRRCGAPALRVTGLRRGPGVRASQSHAAGR